MMKPVDSSKRPSERPSPAEETVLATIVDVFLDTGKWPTHYHVDTTVERVGLELNDVLKGMPTGWFFPDPRGYAGAFYMQPDHELGVTVLGAFYSRRAQKVLRGFMQALKWAVQARGQVQMPSPNEYVEPNWPFPDFLRAIQSAEESSWLINEAVLILELMNNEPSLPSWSGSLVDPYQRQLSIPREVRRLREVDTIEEYVELREKELAHQVTPRQVDELRVREPEEVPLVEVTAAIFVVHGHDEARKQETAQFLRSLCEEEVVILHEQPNRGTTVIEKFERHASLSTYAVVLLTPDDMARVMDAEEGVESPRARQNVVFELGFFVGLLGRERVAILYKAGVELPSDIEGLVYINLDPAGAWKQQLARELHAAGLHVDATKLLEY
jgi:predicted nucleotide-binding protein